MQRIVRSPRLVLAGLAALILHSGPAAAQWTGRGELGVVVASGNSDTKAGNARIAVTHKADAWTNAGGFSAVYSSNELGSTAQRWEATEQSDYKFNPHNFWFGGARYENDHFSGFRHQGTISSGIGHLFLDSETTQLKAQLGVGYKFFEKRDVFSDAGVLITPGETGDSIAGIGNVDFKHDFNASTTLLNKLTVEYTSQNTFLQNDLALQVRMSDKLAVALGYGVRRNSAPPAGFGKTDTLTTVNIVYEVK